MIVYWCAYSENDTISQFKFTEPKSVLTCINENYTDLPPIENFKMCPAYRDYFKNVFELPFPCDYQLTFTRKENGTQVSSNLYDQKFFEEMIAFRSPRHNLYSYNIRYMFFVEESLDLSMERASFSNTEFASKTMLLSGKFNIGKWFRPLDCAFVVNDGITDIPFKENDPYAYVRFHTEEKIIFKRFYRSDKIKELHLGLFNARNYRPKSVNPLSFFYDIYERIKIKSLLSKEVHANLMD
jgi:hypothetical protein